MAKGKKKYLTIGEIHGRSRYWQDKGYTIPKYLQFADELLSQGYLVQLYEAKHTFSKYLHVTWPKSGKWYKVRFSNHPANPDKENANDSDFYVGYGNQGINNTAMALRAVADFFKDIRDAYPKDIAPQGDYTPPGVDPQDLPW